MSAWHHGFRKIEAGYYRNGRYTIISHGRHGDGTYDWRLYEEFDSGGNRVLHDGGSKSECIRAFFTILRSEADKFKAGVAA